MKVVGYTYDADEHCVDCTKKYVAALLPESGHSSVEAWLEDSDDYPRDSENNELHPIFDTDEAGDTPDHCGDCHAYLDTSWHSGTVDYAAEALIRYINTWLEGNGFGGDPEVLDIWASEMDWMWLGTRAERAKEIYEYIRKEEQDV